MSMIAEAGVTADVLVNARGAVMVAVYGLGQRRPTRLVVEGSRLSVDTDGPSFVLGTVDEETVGDLRRASSAGVIFLSDRDEVMDARSVRVSFS